jgi:5-methylcytosine-specific restriction endonuclease McrA
VKKSKSDESPYSGGRPRKRGGRKKSAAKAGTRQSHSHRDLTSHPTTRNAQVATRAWLLKHYGPHCAYCGVEFHSRVMTLDHVAPRRGQIAYDRRDNLVLACRPCNALKRDQSPLAFLLAVRSRAANLLKYGAHLSAGLLDLARPLIRLPDRPPEPSVAESPPGRIRWGASDDDGPSPYRDE